MAARLLLPVLAALTIVGGCASAAPAIEAAEAVLQPPVEAPEPVTELPPQSLEAGECAVFFWGSGEARPFLAYENFNDGIVRLYLDGAVREFATTARPDSLVPGLRYERRFSVVDTGSEIELSGEIHGGAADGLRIAPAIMRVLRPGGEQMVIPVTGHYACRINP